MKFKRKHLAFFIPIIGIGVVFSIIASLYHQRNVERETQSWLKRLDAFQLLKTNSSQVAEFLQGNKLKFNKSYMYSQNQRTGPPPYLMLTAEAEPITTFDWNYGFRRQYRHLDFEFFNNRLMSCSVETPESLI